MTLIPLTTADIGNETVPTVNARDLHVFLNNGDHFSTWIKMRIAQYNFEENQDFTTFSENTEKGRPRLEYALTLDMAKELSMVERNAKGKEARQYFIECERRAKQPAQLDDPAWLRGTLLTYTERVLELEDQVSKLLPSQEALDRIAEADGSLCITDAAKALQMRPKDLFGWLRQNGWIYRRLGAGHDLGYQSKTTSGLLEHKVTTVLRADGSEKVTEQVRVTPKGLTKLAKLIKPALEAA